MRQLRIIVNMFDTWEIQTELYRILFNHKVVQGSEKLYWRFDGFGEPIPFARWMKEINRLYSKPAKAKTNHSWLIHEDFNDFHSRLRTYLKLLDVSLEILEHDNTLAKQTSTGLKVLIEKCLPHLFDLIKIWSSMKTYSSSPTREIYLSIFPNGKQIELDIKKTGSIAEIRGKETLEKSDLAQLFKRFGLNYNKFNIEDAIQNLSMHRDLLTKYFELLDQENSEPIPDAELGEEGDIEDFDEDDDIDDSGLNTIEDFDEDDDIEDFGLDTIEDFDDDDEDVILFEGTVGDLDKESQEIIKQAENDHLADLVYVGREQDEEKSMNQNVMEKFNLTLDDWNQLSYEDRQKLRDVYNSLH